MVMAQGRVLIGEGELTGVEDSNGVIEGVAKAIQELEYLQY